MFISVLSRRPKHTIVVGPAAAYVVTASNYTPAVSTNVTITAQLVDANNHAVKTAGNVVTWSKSDAGGSFGSPTSTTDANGTATVTFTTSASDVACTVTGTDAGSLTGTSPTIQTHGGTITPDAVIQALIDGEIDAGALTFYTGSPPASTADSPSGVTALADVSMASPAAPSGNLVLQDEITLNTGTGFVNVAGTAAWARIVSIDGLHTYDFLLGTSSGANTVVANTLAWTVGQSVTITLLDAVG